MNSSWPRKRIAKPLRRRGYGRIERISVAAVYLSRRSAVKADNRRTTAIADAAAIFTVSDCRWQLQREIRLEQLTLSQPTVVLKQHWPQAQNQTANLQ